MKQSRRDFLLATGAAGATFVLAGCGGDDEESSSSSTAGGGGGGSSSSTGGGGGGGGEPVAMTFTTWGGPAEVGAYKTIIKAFEAANPGTTIKLQEVPYAEINQGIDASLQAGKAPDLFRTTYNDIGYYGKQGGLSDLSEFFPAEFGAAFTPALWSAVNVDEKPYGVPQHTDVSALVYNVDMLAKAGITDIPKTLDEAWSWERFLEVSRAIKTETGQYAFAMNWQLGGCYRWLTWLHQAGGKMLDGDKPSLSGEAGEKTLAFFKTWKDEKLYPPNAQPKGPQYPDEIFPSQKVAMIFAGDFLLPSLADQVKKFEWGATFMPKDVNAGTDLGGTAVVVSKDAKSPEMAAKFLQFLVTDENQKAFCEATVTLPTLNTLIEGKLDYKVRPDLMPIYTQQVTTLPEDLVRAVSIPGFTAINNAMVKELEAFLVSGQSSTDTLKNMDDAVAKEL